MSEDGFIHESGVSNGDVDWLFRGKSKKLIKRKEKVESETRETSKEIGESMNNEITKETNSLTEFKKTETSKGTETKDTVSNKGAHIEVEVSTSSKVIQNVEVNVEKKTITVKTSPISTSANSNSEKLPITPTTKILAKTAIKDLTNPPISPKQTTPLFDKFKFGRSRSTSTPVPVVRSISPPRRSSVSYLSASLLTDLPDDQIELLRQQSKKAAPQKQATKSSSVSASPPVSRLSSGKRSLFSSFSSKFKSEPIKSPEVIPSAPAPQELTSLTKLPLHEGYPEVSKLFKKRTSSSAHSIGSTRMVLNKNLTRNEPNIAGLDVVIRRVTFAIDKLPMDPQQQIPSRRPRKGDVLIPEDLLAPPTRLSQGILDAKAEQNYSKEELALATENQRRALLEAEKHAQEAHASGRRIALEVSQFKGLLKEESEEVEEVQVDFSIDKPVHMHENHFEAIEESTEEPTLEAVYTRCCHLREILPIPATLKQLKGKQKPLQILKLLNSKPTLIDVLSFSDFIAITPLNAAIFDNVTMTTEMLKHFLLSLAHNKLLEKLSLRNVAINDCGWKYLCKLLSINHNIKKLDISQQKIKTDTKVTSVRSSMNWNIFIEALVVRGGIEELVINGCKLSDETFQNLIERAVIINTCRLGIASTELNVNKAEVVAKWLEDPNCKCIGVDIAFNDLSNGQLKPFVKVFSKGFSNLIFFSLNSTNLSNVEEANELLIALSNVKTLRFLDLSSVPDLFPGIISTLSEYLPRFPNLKRIHFDLNDLTGQSIRAIAEILPHVDGLYHVSLLGHKELSHRTAGTIYTAVKVSKIYAWDLDYDLVPDEISLRLALYLIKNMEQVMVKTRESTENGTTNFEEHDEDLMFDGSLLMQAAEKLLADNDKKYDKEEEIKIQTIITKAFLGRAGKFRLDIHKTIDLLFARRNEGTLTLDGKERLLRFCLLDSALENLVNMFEQQGILKQVTAQEIATTQSPEDHGLSETVFDHGGLAVIGGYFPNYERLDPESPVETEGNVVPIGLTSRPVLQRTESTTTIQAKVLEQEEGEFHRWGIFVQQKKYGDKEDLKQQERMDVQLAQKLHEHAVDNSTEIPRLQLLPSGLELREAVIAAKGIESVTDLIRRINQEVGAALEETVEVSEVDEAYDKLLNDAQRSRKSFGASDINT